MLVLLNACRDGYRTQAKGHGIYTLRSPCLGPSAYTAARLRIACEVSVQWPRLQDILSKYIV